MSSFLPLSLIILGFSLSLIFGYSLSLSELSSLWSEAPCDLISSKSLSSSISVDLFFRIYVILVLLLLFGNVSSRVLSSSFSLYLFLRIYVIIVPFLFGFLAGSSRSSSF